jgi:type I restriction enzyme, S subunit
MAVWNSVNISYVLGKNRIDSEFYKKEDVELEFFLNKLCDGEKLKNVTKEVTERFNKSQCEEFQYNDIGNTDLIYGNVKENIIKCSEAPGRATYINNIDDVLVSSVRPNRNANAIINNNSHLQVGSNGFCNLRSNGLDPNYIFAFSKTKYFIATLVRATTSSMYPSVSNKDILNAPFFTPNENEIIGISQNVRTSRKLLLESESFFERATEILEKELGLDNSDLDDLPNKYISSFNDVILGKRLDPEYFNPRAKTIVQRIKNLEHTTIAQNFYVKNGFAWNSKKFLDDNSGEPVIRIRDIKPTYIDKQNLTSIEKNYTKTITFPKAKAGDIVVGMDGLKYFYGSILEEDCMVNQRVCHIERKSPESISSEYTTFIINSKIGQAQLLRDMTIATTVGHITNVNVAKLVIPIVSKDFHDNITSLVRKSINAKKESKVLLKQAIQRIEGLIETAATK